MFVYSLRFIFKKYFKPCLPRVKSQCKLGQIDPSQRCFPVQYMRNSSTGVNSTLKLSVLFKKASKLMKTKIWYLSALCTNLLEFFSQSFLGDRRTDESPQNQRDQNRETASISQKSSFLEIWGESELKQPDLEKSALSSVIFPHCAWVFLSSTGKKKILLLFLVQAFIQPLMLLSVLVVVFDFIYLE